MRSTLKSTLRNWGGTQSWETRDGRRHRLDGPAVIRVNGQQEWYCDGRLHRLDGPAIKCPNGEEHWYRNGTRHRLDGPAIILADGCRIWCHHGYNVDIYKPIVRDGIEIFLSEEPLGVIYPSARLVEGFATWYWLDDTDATLFKMINTKAEI